MFKLDQYDKIILQELENDASIPLHKLAKKINRSKQFISYRIKKFEQEGLIMNYVGIVDVFSLGYLPFRVYIDFQSMTEKQKEEFIKDVSSNEYIVQAYSIYEQWDVALFVIAKNVMDLRVFWDKILQKYKQNIKEHRILLYAPMHNFNKRFIKPRSPRQVFGIGVENQESIILSSTKLLFEYAKDVRQPYTELAKIAKKSIETVKKDIKKYNASLIVGRTLVLNPQVIGLRYFQVTFTLSSIYNVKKIFAHCKEEPLIFQIHRIIGGEDFEICVIAKDKVQLLSIIDSIKENFSNIVDDSYFEYMPVFSRGIIPC